MNNHLSNEEINILILNKISLNTKIKHFMHWKNCSSCTEKIIQTFQTKYLHTQTQIKTQYFSDFYNIINFRIIANENKIISIHFLQQNDKKPNLSNETNPLIEKFAKSIIDYFQGNPIVSLNLQSLDFDKLTIFAIKVYLMNYLIPFGHTLCYSNIAKLIGSAGASQAVGQVLKRNPFPLIIPCHRVIGKNKSLTGFAGGLSLKKTLLTLENTIL